MKSFQAVNFVGLPPSITNVRLSHPVGELTPSLTDRDGLSLSDPLFEVGTLEAAVSFP